MPETINSRAAHVREYIDTALHDLEGLKDWSAPPGLSTPVEHEVQQSWFDRIITMLQHASLIAEGIEADTDETPPF